MKAKKKIYNIKNINEKIAEDARKLILDTESKYRGQLFALADKILQRRNVNMVLLAGPSCAGKTTSARLLKEIFEKRGKHVVTISMDDFFIDREKTPLLPNGMKDYDNPKAINTLQMKECFEKLYKTGKAMFPIYDFKTGKNVPDSVEIELRYNSIIIFEGLHVLNPYILNNLGETNYFTIYVNALSNFKSKSEKMSTTDIRLLRRMIRDMGRRGNSIELTLKTWEQVCDAERKYINPYIKNAQEVVDTTHEYELGIFRLEFNNLIEGNKSFKKKIQFYDILNSVLDIDKSDLPDTTLMWEFIDIPKVEKVKENKEKVNDIEEITYES